MAHAISIVLFKAWRGSFSTIFTLKVGEEYVFQLLWNWSISFTKKSTHSRSRPILHLPFSFFSRILFLVVYVKYNYSTKKVSKVAYFMAKIVEKCHNFIKIFYKQSWQHWNSFPKVSFSLSAGFSSPHSTTCYAIVSRYRVDSDALKWTLKTCSVVFSPLCVNEIIWSIWYAFIMTHQLILVFHYSEWFVLILFR